MYLIKWSGLIYLYACCRLECEVQADLRPVTVKWTHDGKELQRSDRMEEVFVEERGLAKLTIKDFTAEDAGEYTCEVSGRVIEPESGELPRARTISTSTVVEVAETMPEVAEEKPSATVEEQPVLETPKVQVCELKFTKPLQPALTPNEERVLE